MDGEPVPSGAVVPSRAPQLAAERYDLGALFFCRLSATA